jgi:hypothetical protein
MDLSCQRNCLEALQSKNADQWYQATKDELDNLQIHGTWKLFNTVANRAVDLHPIKSKYASRFTVKPYGYLKFKARLVACGYSQIPENLCTTAKHTFIMYCSLPLYPST